MSTINFNFFRFSWKFIFIGQFFILICNFRIIFIVVYCVVFLMIILFAGWRYAGRIFNAGICRGKAISEFRSPKASPCTPTLLGTEVILRCCVCCVVDFCLYAAVLKMECCADLVSVFFGTYGGTLCRSAICSLYSSIFMMVRCADLVPVFFDIYGDTLGRSSSCILRYLW